MVLDFGRKIADGLPAEIMANAYVKKAYLGEDMPGFDEDAAA
jgi:branched-chain amino acid transport system ATP-binding protein